MTTKSTHVTSPSRALRSTLRFSAPVFVAASVIVAAPAMADVPEAWTTPDDPGFFSLFMLLVGWPVIAAAVIGGLVFLLNLRKGETKYDGIDGEWAGGPRATAAVTSAEASKGAGGASGSY